MIFVINQLFASNAVGLTSQTEVVQLPKGNWSFSAHPYSGTGYDSRPVMVTSVLSDSSKNLTVTKVKVKNLSAKTVTAVKLAWVLMNEGDNSILQRGETPLIGVSKILQPGGKQTIVYPVVNFGKLSKNFLNNGTLTGNYRIDIIVTEAVFEDESNWIGKNRTSQYFPQFALWTASSSQAGCPRQKCKYVSEGGSHYICEGSSNPEFCTNCSSSCIVTLCGEDPQSC